MERELLRKRDRDRHVRTLWYVGASLGMSLFCYLAFDFSRLKTFGYCVAAYVLLNLLSYRQMFGKGEQPVQSPSQHDSTE